MSTTITTRMDKKTSLVENTSVNTSVKLQSILTLYTLINISCSVTAISLRLVAKLLNDLADRLEVPNKSLNTTEKEAMYEANVKYDISKTSLDTKDYLDVKYNQLLASTHKNLQEESLVAFTGDNLVHNSISRWRNDSVDSGLGDMDFIDIDNDTGLTIISLAEVADHCSFDDAWMVIYDKVYDVTEYLDLHPGGQEVMLEYVGYDSTVAFRGVAHSKAAFRSLNKYCVGILPEAERLNYDPDL